MHKSLEEWSNRGYVVSGKAEAAMMTPSPQQVRACPLVTTSPSPEVEQGSEIAILLVDDTTLVRQGIASLLAGQPGVRVVGEAEDAREAVAKAGQLNPDIVLMEVRMSGSSGAEATRQICQQSPGVNVIFLTTSDREEDVLDAVTSGAKGYLLKSADIQSVVAAINRVAQGEIVIWPSLANRLWSQLPLLFGRQQAKSGYFSLTSQERRVLQMVASGSSNREIADRLVIAETTVKTHLRNVFDKLQVRSRVEAAAIAFRVGLCDGDSYASRLVLSAASRAAG